MVCPLTFAGIEFTELRGSGDFKVDQTAENQSTTRVLGVEWSRAYELAQAIVGRHVNSGGGIQTYEPPQVDPERNWLFATSVQGEGQSMIGQDPSGGIAYQRAHLTVTYSARKNDQTQPGGPGNTVTFLTESRQGIHQAISIPTDKLVWSPGAPKAGLVVGDDATNFIPDPITSISYNTSFWFFAPLDNTFDDAASSVNDADITILGRTYPKGKLKFMFGNPTRQFTSDGQEAVQVVLTIHYRRNEWNKTFDPDSGQFEGYQTAAGTPIHPDLDFKTLFPVGLVT